MTRPLTDLASGPPEYPHELWCPSVDVCAFCSDSECDGIGCVAALDPDDEDDQPYIEQIQAWVRLGRIQEQANTFLAVVENRTEIDWSKP